MKAKKEGFLVIRISSSPVRRKRFRNASDAYGFSSSSSTTSVFCSVSSGAFCTEVSSTSGASSSTVSSSDIVTPVVDSHSVAMMNLVLKMRVSLVIT